MSEKCKICLSNNCFLSNIISKNLHTEFKQNITCLNFSTGEKVPFSNFKGDFGLLIIENGLAYLAIDNTFTPNNKEVIISIHSKSLLQLNNNITITFLEDSKICLISNPFYNSQYNNNSLFRDFIHNALTTSLNTIETKNSLFNILSAQEKLILSIYKISNEIGYSLPFGIIFLSKYCSISKEEVSRSLKALRDQEIIEISKNKISVINYEKLKAYFNSFPTLRNLNNNIDFNHLVKHF
jgi:CRP-like cAMP-binding protein